MPRSLTQLLNAHHDKLNEHTEHLIKIDAEIEHLTETVSALEAKLSKTNKDDDSGLRAGLRDWIASIRELM